MVTKETNIRKPCVAGQFYPLDPKSLTKLISSFADKATQKNDVLGCMLPHAGYIYSGQVAVETISSVNIKDTVILLGPNHTGLGAAFSIMTEGIWQTPLGNIEIDQKLAKLFLDKSKYLKADILAHIDEHSLEVELPILQYFKNNFKIGDYIHWEFTGDTRKITQIRDNIVTIDSPNNFGDRLFHLKSNFWRHATLEEIHKAYSYKQTKDEVKTNDFKIGDWFYDSLGGVVNRIVSVHGTDIICAFPETIGGDWFHTTHDQLKTHCRLANQFEIVEFLEKQLNKQKNKI